MTDEHTQDLYIILEEYQDRLEEINQEFWLEVFPEYIAGDAQES